ncbi:YbjN domain-containing protein [Leucobacter allii]|uniref:YbjN domain-containing protein n=1 Tax=Leucobacter allii TaxID=2932247 RepID=A0ABY4FQH0_9MICO|nr:YbjN domain-containing protein [Leucobacter allii]UOQ58522.1 YbjN domain-containing protein [Leucobacter allii]
MGFFTKDAAPTPGAAGSLAPLSKDRIKAALESAGWSYTVDGDGDIGGGWEYGSFYFFVNGSSDELLCVRGYWRGRLDEGDYLRALETANQWNAEKLWPKAYVARDDEGAVRLNTEHNVDYEHGLSDDQLMQHLVCTINTSMAFFEHVNETFPEAWAKVRPEA